MSGNAGDRATGYFNIPWDGKVGMEHNGRNDRMDEAGYVGQCRRPVTLLSRVTIIIIIYNNFAGKL